jgi:hypothetical protein
MKLGVEPCLIVLVKDFSFVGYLDDIGFGHVGPTILKCDNQSAIKLIKSPIFHDKSKHFEKDWRFAHQQVE